MRVQIRRGKQRVLRLNIHMNNAVPAAFVRTWFVGSIAAIAEGVCHGVEDMPQKRFRKHNAVCALINDDHNVQGLRWYLYRCVWYQAVKSQRSP